MSRCLFTQYIPMCTEIYTYISCHFKMLDWKDIKKNINSYLAIAPSYVLSVLHTVDAILALKLSIRSLVLNI